MIYRVIFEPRAPIFIGHNSLARKSAALVHSDTLHAALIDVAAIAGFNLINAVQELRVSSVFPCWNDLFFYPKPFLPMPRPAVPSTPIAPSTDRKRLKSLRWVSQRVLDAWLQNDSDFFSDEKSIVTLGEDTWISAEEKKNASNPLPEKLIHRDLAPAVTVDRVSSAASPYERRGLRLWRPTSADQYATNVKAWFLADVPEKYKHDFENTVDLLGTYGIGGERSVGYGAFDHIEYQTQNLSPWLQPPIGKPKPNLFYSISLYLPTKQEILAGVLDPPAAYDCTIREGWIHGTAGTTAFKKSTRMCLEGGVFQRIAEHHGETRDVTPENFNAHHPVFRSGKAFEFPFHRDHIPVQQGA